MHPKELSIKDYTYELPPGRIAKHPLPERDQSKLLIWDNGTITESRYAEIVEFIPAESLLVFNNTKVIEARLLFTKSSGGTIEVFCLEPDDQYADITVAMLRKRKVWWKCLVGGAKKWKDEPLSMDIGNGSKRFSLMAKKIEQVSDYYIIELEWDNDLSFADVLHQAGAIPLPPYIDRPADKIDKERYQTIYAVHDGSVAAPTAGLHFTGNIFTSLRFKHIAHDFVTLHVGAGTFKPVKATTMQDHEMHAEFIDVNRPLIKKLLLHLHTAVIAVGTTSLRTIETLYWLGVKTILNPLITPAELQLSQWEAYELSQHKVATEQALRSLLHWLDLQMTERLITRTQIIIAPGYSFRIIDGLITNFHQPQSTLLLLVAAITGDDWKKIYDYAQEHDFRFLSYGDGSLLWLPQ
jgi:S-adenosylmethionine:tRNA ribosyltransferase-isomerase